MGHLQPGLVLPSSLPQALGAEPLCPPWGGAVGLAPGVPPTPAWAALQRLHLPIPLVCPDPLGLLSHTQHRQRGRLLLTQRLAPCVAPATLCALSWLRPHPRGTVRMP